MAGDWRKLHKKELHNLNSSPNIIKMIKSRRMRRAGYAVRMWKNRKKNIGFRWESQKERDTGGRIILRWILEL
jgi:hypothetical protein